MKCLIAKDKGIHLAFKALSWDTRFFGKDAFILEKMEVRSRNTKTDRLAEQLPEDSFIAARIPRKKKALEKLFREIGFTPVATAVTLRYDGSRKKVRPGEPARSIAVVKYGKNRGLPYQLLGETFLYSRFHRDAKIPRLKADRLWVEYLKNFTVNARNHMFVAKIKSHIVGVLLLQRSIKRTDRRGEITYLSVAKRYQDKGAGSALLGYATGWALDRGIDLYVGTQAENKKAMHFYKKNGFAVTEERAVLHRWS